MFRDLLNRIVELSQQAARKEVVQLPGIHSAVFVPADDGTLCRQAREPNPRAANLHTLEDIVRMVSEMDGVCNKPEVYVSPQQVSLIIDGEARHEAVRCTLSPTETFKTLSDLADRPWTGTPGEAIRLLRFELAGIGPDAISAFRTMEFSRNDRTSRTIEHGEESLGRAVQAQVAEADNIPEVIVIHTPVYSNPDLTITSACAVMLGVHINLEDQTITFKPLAEEIPRAIQAAVTAIVNSLRNDVPTLPVFYGSP